MPDPRLPEDTDPIADAAALLNAGESRGSRPPPAVSSPSAATGGGYDLDADPLPADDEPPRPPILPKAVERPKSKPKARPAESGSNEFAGEVATVDPVWTRGGEWGPDLVKVGLAGLITLVLAWFSGGFVLGLVVLVVGGAVTALLSYPMLITLERPVRITPEQAVTDFFAAASHHVPHYRRMWLLLSSAGRESGPFPTFGVFREHWKARIEGWKRARVAGKFAPLEFQVEDFKADKSTGNTTSRADYTVRVVLRDKPGEAPIGSFRMVHGLAKGPDRMWYLNRGTLPPGPG